MSRLEANIHPLLTEEIIRALNLKQIFTVLDFIKADTQSIVKSALFNFREVLAVKNFLLKKFSAAPRNGFDCYKATLKNTAIIPTGIKGVDCLLQGGFFTGNLYELCGLPASGKTHFILTVIKNAIKNMHHQVYVLDTKNDFSVMKLRFMLGGSDKVQQTTNLSKVVIQQTFTRYDLINSLYSIKCELENNLQLRLIVIDSLPCVLLNSSDVGMNNSYLNHLANIMKYIATKHHVTFLISNLITTWNEGDFKAQQNNTVENILCGRYWYSITNTRLKIEKLENENRCRVSVLNSDTVYNKINSSTDILLTEDGFL